MAPTLCQVFQDTLARMFENPSSKTLQNLQKSDPSLLERLVRHLKDEECTACQDWTDAQEFPEELSEEQTEDMLREVDILVPESEDSALVTDMYLTVEDDDTGE